MALPAIAIGCLDRDGLAPRSHTHADTAENVDETALDETVNSACCSSTRSTATSAGCRGATAGGDRQVAQSQAAQTGVTGLRFAGHSRCLPAASAKRLISSSRRVLGLDHGVDHELGGQVQDVDVLRVLGAAAPRSCAARSSGSSIAWSWL